MKIKYHVGYDISQKITLKPDSILVSGPENYISKIKNIELLPLVLEDVKADFTKKLLLKLQMELKT